MAKRVKLLSAFTSTGKRVGEVVTLTDRAARHYADWGLGKVVGEVEAVEPGAKAAKREKAVKRARETR